MRMSMIEGLERALEKMEESGSLKVEGGRRPSLVNTRWNNDQNDDNDDDNDNDTESIMYLPDTSDNVSSSTLLTLHTFYTGDTKTTAPSCTCGDRDDGSSKTNEFSR